MEFSKLLSFISDGAMFIQGAPLFCQMFHLFHFIPASRVDICVEVTSTVVFPWPIPQLWSYFYPKAGWTYVLWYPSYFFCCGLVPTVAMISIIHPKIERKFCFLNKPNVIQIQKTFTQMHANFHRFHKKTNIFWLINLCCAQV